jgi:hypothetical protein
MIFSQHFSTMKFWCVPPFSKQTHAQGQVKPLAQGRLIGFIDFGIDRQLG